jgi:hypothetical protein
MTTHTDDFSAGTRSSHKARMSLQFLRECFEYRDGVLYWRDRPSSHFKRPADHATFIKKSAGKPAGRKAADGYIQIKFRLDGLAVCVSAHHVIWALHNGKWPEQTIDHMNRIRHDNRIGNLRDVAQAENGRNSVSRRVHPYVGPHKWGGFSAQVRIGDKAMHIGIFDTEAEAVAHRNLVNAALDGLASSLAKKSKIGRRCKDRDQTFDRAHVDGGKQ